MQPVIIRAVRLLAISLTVATALPAAPALAGWRDGPYYSDDGWAPDDYPRARAYRPAPVYRDDYQPNYGYYRRPWTGRQAYAPGYYDEPGYLLPDEDVGPRVRPRVVRPPRNVSVAPDRRLVPAKPKPVVVLPSQKGEPVKPKVAVAAPAVKPASVEVARALPVPRPNLESMDFETAAPAPMPAQ